ncbi:SLAP domain-containing protein [Psychrobacillus sp. OK032]|uniref:SLAP domain-containing protein n=1 Tax=Psychrobacillus sp. OK032 TaxID=1884358 RepID=UPI0008C219DE|nr:SLAP domain-containing protein [Psychrobacillus sp. OK032]SES42295.1 SLAP domain-containing protein [Psychrobacillus sp. OK032]
MQKLMFESSWNKALSDKDRNAIEKTFLETSKINNDTIQLTPLWKAFNHKGELLVTVLIHNFTEHSFSLDGTKLRYSVNNEILAEHSFTRPLLAIQAKYSMPWTFIFPKEKLDKKLSHENGLLEII